MSKKENCFKQALDTYLSEKQRVGESPEWGARWKQTWVERTATGRWEMSNRTWFNEIGSQMKTMASRLDPTALPGLTRQVRSPDLTLLVEGATWIVDLKFSGDRWRDRRGLGNNNTQLEDYNSINRQNNPGTDMDDPSLNPQSCNCQQRMKAEVREYVEAPDQVEAYDRMMKSMQGQFFFLPLPSASPSGALDWLLDALGLGGRAAPEGLSPALGGAH